MAIYREKTLSVSLDSNAVLQVRMAGALTTIPQVAIELTHINFSNNHIDYKNTQERTYAYAVTRLGAVCTTVCRRLR
jgi:hypothetical protein